MEKQVHIKIITEKSLALTAKILLGLNRKRLQLSTIKTSELNHLKYQHLLLVIGEEKMIKNALVFLNKLVGVYSITEISTTEHQTTPVHDRYQMVKDI